MLMTEVYPTDQATEGYLAAVPSGKIEGHLTLDQLKNFPGICLENDEVR